MYCDKCGTENNEGMKFCESCGATLPEVENQAAEVETVEVQEDVQQEFVMEEQPVKPAANSVIKRIIAAVLAILIIFGVGTVIKNVFFKSDEIDYTKHPILYRKDNDTLMMKSANKKTLFELGEIDAENPYYDYEISDDGKHIFFGLDEEDDGGFNLYYRKTDKKKMSGKNADEHGVKLSGDVSNFRISAKGDKVLYRKTNGKLALNNTKKEIEIAEDVNWYGFDINDKNLYYYDNDGTLYIRGLGKNDKAIKIGKNVQEIIKFDGKEIYYVDEDNNLCFKKGKKDKVEVASDVVNAWYDNVDKEIYVQSGDSDQYDLLKVNGKKTKTIIEDVIGSYYSVYVTGDPDDFDDAKVNVMKKNGKVIGIENFDMDEMSAPRVTKDDKYVYIMEDISDEGTGTLMRYQLKGKKLKNPKEVASDVENYFVNEDGTAYVYLESDDTNKLGFYNGKKFYDVSDDAYMVGYEDGALFYIDDFSKNGAAGTLCKFEKGKVKEIAEDVINDGILLRSKKCIYFIKDFEEGKDEGDLYFYNGKKATKIDGGVSEIISEN